MQGWDVMDLDLSDNAIRDIGPLRGCHIHGRLNLSGNPIEDISALQGKSLTGLELQHTAVQDLSPLLKLPDLEWVDLRGLDLDENARRVQEELVGVRTTLGESGGGGTGGVPPRVTK